MITQETGVSIFKGAENRAAGVTLLTAAANLADETRKTSKEALPRFLIGGVTPHGPQANCLVVATSLQASAVCSKRSGSIALAPSGSRCNAC
jgi:hypothetical protein